MVYQLQQACQQPDHKLLVIRLKMSTGKPPRLHQIYIWKYEPQVLPDVHFENRAGADNIESGNDPDSKIY